MTNTELDEFWQQAVADWQASVLSGAAFCKQQSLIYHRFIYWRQKLTQGTPVTPAAGFALVEQHISERHHEGLTLTLPGSIMVTELHPDNITLLAALLRQL